MTATATGALATVAGAALVLATIRSAIRTLVLPRAARSVLVRAVFGAWRALYLLRASERRPYAARDHVLATFAPVALLSLPMVWLGLTIVGFGLMFWGVDAASLADAFVLSGSSVLTLGFERPAGTLPTVMAFVEAGLGLGLVGLLISYLPTIYAAFSRREGAVALLEGLAGSPPSPVELLARHHAIGGLDRLGELFERWQDWFADVQESHTSVPALCFFRSPRPDHSWVTAAACVLDAAALRLSCLYVPTGAAEASLCIRAGFVTLRHIADFFGLPYDNDPAPSDPISVTREEFDEAFEHLRERGLPVKRNQDRAWQDYAGWRVNYDDVVRAFAALVVAAPAGWPTGEPGHFRAPRRRAVGLSRRVRPAPRARRERPDASP